jgi:hypothetical protein
MFLVHINTFCKLSSQTALKKWKNSFKTIVLVVEMKGKK